MSLRTLLGLLCLTACDPTGDRGPSADVDVEPIWCEGPTRQRYDVAAAQEVQLFPDGLLVQDDPASPTGERLAITPEVAPWLEDASPILKSTVEGMNALSGFGVLGGALLRFDGPVAGWPTTPEESVSNDAWIWADLSTTPPTRVPFDVQVIDDGAGVVLWPTLPLDRATPHAVVVTTSARDTAGSCLSPSASTRSLLWSDADEGGLTGRFERVRPAYREAAAALGLQPSDVSAITVFGTHDDFGPMIRAAEQVVEAPVAWGAWEGCEERERMLQCGTSINLLDMRNASGLVDDTVTPLEQQAPVMIWLPTNAKGPVPMLVFGHGLQSQRQDGWEVAKRVQDAGIGVVAMPAVAHGEHPSVDPEDDTSALFRFLAVDVATLTIDPLALRGNMNQTNLDRLRLLKLLRSDPDVDGDGDADIEPERIAYIGASLGAVLGPGLLALDEELEAAVFTIGGGRMGSLLRDLQGVPEEFVPLLELALGEGGQSILAPLAQHALDPIDPAAWAPHVLKDRFDGRMPPSLLYAVGLEDEIFSIDSGNTLARALGVPHIGPVVTPVPLLEQGGPAPVSGNAFGGERTLGFFQYDRITTGDDPTPRRPTHGASARSNESGEQLVHFLETALKDGLPEIVDPYEVLGTAERPETW